MITDKQQLEYIYDNAQMGKVGITQLIEQTDDLPFRKALEAQLQEYQSIMDTSEKMLQQRGVQPHGITPMAKMSSYIMTKMKTLTDSSSCTLAEMMIQGSNLGIIEITKHLNEYDGADKKVTALSHKLLETEQNNINQMKTFLQPS